MKRHDENDETSQSLSFDGEYEATTSHHDSDKEVVEVDSQLKETRITSGHLPYDIIGDPKGVKTWRHMKNIISHMCFTCKIEPKKVK